jgi:hypothetical protein
LNAELRHAQLELLSAQCATDRVRLRFSIEDIAQHGQPDLLRRAINTVTAMHDYYTAIGKQCFCTPTPSKPGSFTFDDELIREAVSRVSVYLREQREHYFPLGKPLTDQQRNRMERFFQPGLLARVRIVELAGRRLPNPPFYSQAKALGFANLPEITHMSSVTFLDVIVFNEKVTERALFDGLVHAIQFELLGLEKYTEMFVRGFRDKNSHFNVTLEAHVIAMESSFASGHVGFSVEEQVWLWINQGRYLDYS